METVRFPAADGYELGGTLYRAADARAALVLNGGTAVPHRFYRRFAEAAAEAGFTTLAWDYRGTGASAPKVLRGFAASIVDIGRLDMPAALDFLAAQAPGRKLGLVGHSVGGQLLGLMPNQTRLSAAAMVACSTGHWGGQHRPMRYVWWALANLYFPLAIAATGYVPGRPVGLGENLPAGIARQWRHWSARADYMGRDFAGPLADHGYDDVRLPIRWVGLTDDWVATPSTVAALQAHYRHAAIETSWHRPAETGVKTIGHLGYFRPDQGGALWPALFDWLGVRLF